MRTEDELRAALRLLDQPAPSPLDVLRALDRQARTAASSSRSGIQRHAWVRRLRDTLAATTAAAALATVTGTSKRARLAATNSGRDQSAYSR